MADAELENLLSRCPQPEAGCFASDSEALQSMLYFDDGAIRTTLKRIAAATDDAATEGIPFDEITFRGATIEVIEEIPDRRPGHIPTAVCELGEGEEERVVDLENGDKVDQLGLRIAKCAYACGSAAMNICPLKTPAADS